MTSENTSDVLVVATPADIQPVATDYEVSPEMAKKAEEFVALALAYNPKSVQDQDVRTRTATSVEVFGNKLQEQASRKGAMLAQPIKDLANKGEDGGPVANALVDLTMQLDALDPGKFDFNPGWLARACGWIPFIGSPVKRYFTQYESAQVVIAQIIRSLEEGREVLKRDNHSIKGDQEEMRRLTIRLGEAVQMGKLIDAKLSEALKHMEDDPMADEDRHRYLEEELLFPLRQRLMDIEQQLLVNQQGVIAIEVVIRNNKELIKGVDRAINVTVNALSVAVTVALALANQKIVLNKIKLVNDTTNNLIAYTAKELRTVGTEIHKQASTLSLDLGTLKQAFTDFNAAMQDISNFRREALPNMAKAILEMDDLASKSEQTIQRMELGNQAAPQMLLDI